DRRRFEAFAVLGRRDHAFRESRARFPAAVRATIDRRAVLRHFDRPFGQVEHLASLYVDHRTRREAGATMAADGRGVLEGVVGVGDLAKRVAAVALLSAARLARARTQALENARLLLQPVAR